MVLWLTIPAYYKKHRQADVLLMCFSLLVHRGKAGPGWENWAGCTFGKSSHQSRMHQTLDREDFEANRSATAAKSK